MIYCQLWTFFIELKGLMGKSNEVEDFEEHKKPSTSSPVNANIPKTSNKRRASNNRIHNPEENRTIAIPSDFSGDLEELEQRVKSMMEKSQNSYANETRLAHRCKVCGKEGMGSAIKDHIEANHLEGIIVPCGQCEKTFGYRNGLKKHLRKDHKKYHSE